MALGHEIEVSAIIVEGKFWVVQVEPAFVVPIRTGVDMPPLPPDIVVLDEPLPPPPGLQGAGGGAQPPPPGPPIVVDDDEEDDEELAVELPELDELLPYAKHTVVLAQPMPLSPVNPLGAF